MVTRVNPGKMQESEFKAIKSDLSLIHWKDAGADMTEAYQYYEWLTYQMPVE